MPQDVYVILKSNKAEFKWLQTSFKFSLVKNKSNTDNQHLICVSPSNSPTTVHNISLHSLWLASNAVICLMSFHTQDYIRAALLLPQKLLGKRMMHTGHFLLPNFCCSAWSFWMFSSKYLINALTQTLHPQWNWSPNSVSTNRKELENWLTNHQVQYWNLSGHYKYTGRQQQTSSMPDSRDNSRPWSMMFAFYLRVLHPHSLNKSFFLPQASVS